MKFFKKRNKEGSTTEDGISPKKVFVDIMTGNILAKDVVMKQVPLMLLVVILSLIYINNRFLYESELSRNQKLRTELVNKKCESLTKLKELLELERRSGVQDKLQKMNSNLQESFTPVVLVE